MLQLKRWGCGVLAAVLCCQMAAKSPAIAAADPVPDFPLAQITWAQNGDILVPVASHDPQSDAALPESSLDPSLGALYGAEAAEELPESYSLLDVDGQSYITSVKDQGQMGLCWAYSALGACESNILVQGLEIPEDWIGPSGELDFSEGSLSWYIYTRRMQLGDLASGDYVILDGKGVAGGNATIASYALAAGIGPQLEQYAPMTDWDRGYSEYQRYTAYYQMESSDILWTLDSDGEDVVKQWIMDTGAVSASYYSASAYYDNGTSSAYYQTRHDADDADHAILIVGWDDNYSRDNFSSAAQPTRDGAWLIRNSWGTDDAYGGYFWISYDEPSLCELARFHMTPCPEGQTRHQYDGGVTYSGIVADAAANVFTAQEDCTLDTIMFPLSSLNTTQVRYEISVYLLGDTDTNPDSGTLLTSTTGIATYSGYKSVDLETPVALNQGDRFGVVLSLSRAKLTDRRPYIAIESDTDDIASSRCLIRAGQSYVCNGSGNWFDVYDLRETVEADGTTPYGQLGNVAIKALTTATDTSPNRAQLDMALSYGAPSTDSGALYQLAYIQALALGEDAAQWEIDNAAANLLAGLEQAGVVTFPQHLYLTRRRMLGDVTLDEVIAIDDAYETLLTYSRSSVGFLDALLPAQVAAADIDENGDISIWDAYAILLYYANQSAGNALDWDGVRELIER